MLSISGKVAHNRVDARIVGGVRKAVVILNPIKRSNSIDRFMVLNLLLLLRQVPRSRFFDWIRNLSDYYWKGLVG